MSRRRFFIRRSREAIIEQLRVSKWPPANGVPQGLTKEEEALFDANVDALEAYVNRKSADEILRESGLSIHDAARLAERAGKRHPLTKEHYGWRVCDPTFKLDAHALPPHDPIEGEQGRRDARLSRRSALMASNTGRGALKRLLDRKPAIREKLDAAILDGDFGLADKVVNPTTRHVHERFKKLCHDNDVGSGEWPFNTQREGYEAVRGYHQLLKLMNPKKTAVVEGGKDAVATVNYQDARTTSVNMTPVVRAMERCEVDPWLADYLLSAFYKDCPQLAEILEPLRPNLYLAVDRGSGALYPPVPYLTDAPAALRRTLRNIVGPHRRRDIPGYPYPEGPCFPQEIPELLWHRPLDIAVDLASHHKQLQLDSAVQTLGLRISAPNTPNTSRERVGVEGMAGTFTDVTRHWKIGTGNRPNSPYRRTPEAFATQYAISRLVDFGEMFAARLNTATHADGTTAIGRIQHALSVGSCCMVSLREEVRSQVEELLSPAFAVDIHHVKGQRPYVEYQSARYYAEAGSDDAKRLEWYGSRNYQNMRLHILEDASRGVLYQLNGAQEVRLCALRAMHRVWGRPHVLLERELYSRLRKANATRSTHRASVAAELLELLRKKNTATLGLTHREAQRWLTQLSLDTDDGERTAFLGDADGSMPPASKRRLTNNGPIDDGFAYDAD